MVTLPAAGLYARHAGLNAALGAAAVLAPQRAPPRARWAAAAAMTGLAAHMTAQQCSLALLSALGMHHMACLLPCTCFT